jgi:hypothetical protein
MYLKKRYFLRRASASGLGRDGFFLPDEIARLKEKFLLYFECQEIKFVKNMILYVINCGMVTTAHIRVECFSTLWVLSSSRRNI